MPAPNWTEDAEVRMNLTFDRMASFSSTDGGALTMSPAHAAAQANLRWAIWCVESLHELKDLADIDDARGENITRLGHRRNPIAMGHMMWACVTAIAALDRVAVAIGALHLESQKKGRLYDFGQVTRPESYSVLPSPIRGWIDSVRNDPAYADVLVLLRNPMTHGTTYVALYGRVGELPAWEDRTAHLDAPGFYTDTEYTRSLTVPELLSEAIPLAERAVRDALELVEKLDFFRRPL